MGLLIRKWGLCSSCIVLLILFCIPLQAQTFSEWFRQKRIQRKYLAEQIAALHLYAGYVKKGYQIAGDGLSLVKGFSGGEFDLHRLYLSSLKAVSPVVSKDPKVSAMVKMSLDIRQQFAAIEKMELPSEYKSYVMMVKKNLLERCQEDLVELEQLTSSGKLEMKDDERIQRLGTLHESMAEKLAFARDFAQQAKLLSAGKKRDRKATDIIRRYHGTD